MSIIHKKVLAEGESYILFSELHSIEELYNNGKITLRMNNGVTVNLVAHFVQDLNDYGPSALIGLDGTISNRQGNIIKTFEENQITIAIGEKKEFEFKDDNGQFIQIKLLPEII